MFARIKQRIPFFQTLDGYGKDDLKADTTAGMTTAVMLIPQAMAYAMLAGLPPIVGLFASVVPLALYAFLGTSRQLAVGPVAMVSLLVAAGVGALGPASTSEYVAYAVLLAGLVGVIQLAMGVFRAGFLVNFLSHPVISGFTSAAALIIGFSQLKHLLGVDIARSHYVHRVLLDAVAQVSHVEVATVVIGAVAIALLIGLKKWAPRAPRALIVVAFGTIAVWLGNLSNGGVAIVGTVPAGLPHPSLPSFDLAAIESLLPVALTIALVGFMESISVAKAFARKGGYEVSPNQDLVALGVANIGGAFFGAYPVTGGFSRTAVNAQAGARTTIASLVTAGFVALTLLFLTPLFYYLPKAVLAAIIMTAVFGLIDFREVRHLWHVKRSDLGLLVITFVGTLSLGIEQGILLGVGVSLLVFIVRSTRPHTATLGRLPNGEYRSIDRHADANTVPGLLIVRMDASFYFGNVTFLRTTLRELEAAAKEPLRAVILDASAINQLDSSADTALHELKQDYGSRGIRFILTRVKGPVMEVLERSGYRELAGDDGFAESVEEAVEVVTGEGLVPVVPPAASDDERDANVEPRLAAAAGLR